MNSLKSRLLIWVCGSAAAVTVLGAIALFVLVRWHQINQLDRRVLQRARLIVSMIELDGDSVEIEFEQFDLRDFQSKPGGWYLAVWVDGLLAYRSGSFQNQPPPANPHAAASPAAGWIRLPGRSYGRGRYFSFDSEPAGGLSPPIAVLVACDASQVLAACRNLAIGLTAVTGATILLMAVILTGVVNRSMRVVVDLAQQIKQIDAADLDERVASASLPSELEPIVVQFNAMLARLQGAFKRERGFCADVAHELRTPLAGLRTTLEVAQRRSRTGEQYAQTIDQCRQVVIQTQNLFEALLQIARLETGQAISQPGWVDLRESMQTVWHDLTDRAAGRGNPPPRWKLGSGVGLWTDRGVLTIVIRNLLENALDYGAEQGVVEIESGSSQDGVWFSVANSGSRIAPGDGDNVFKRFWRGSPSRSDTGTHFGLGLSLAQRASQNLGGTLSVETQLDGIFRVRCSLPKRP